MVILAIDLGKFNSMCCISYAASPRANGILPSTRSLQPGG